MKVLTSLHAWEEQHQFYPPTSLEYRDGPLHAIDFVTRSDVIGPANCCQLKNSPAAQPTWRR